MEKKYTKEDIDKSYLGGMAIGKAEGHNKPSPETEQRLGKLELSQSNMSEKIEKIVVDIAEIKVDLKYIKEFFKDLPCKENIQRIDKLENRNFFEKGVIAVLVFIGTLLTNYIVRKFF